MKRLLLLSVFALVAVALGGFFAARQVAQSSNTVGTSSLWSSSPSAFEWDVRDQDPGFSIARGGPSEKAPPNNGPFHAADLLSGIGAPIIRVACAALGLTPAGCAAALPHDEVDALSYGRDFTKPMKPYWKWLFFSVAPGSTGLPGSAVNVEATCAPPEPQADEFWTSAHPALNTNGQYYDGNGVACNAAQSNPGFGLVETPNSDNLDALDEFPAPVVNNMAYFSLGPGSPSLGLGFVTGDVLAKTVGAPGAPGIYASRAALGLAVGDDVDAICVYDAAGDDYYWPPQGDLIWFSLTNASPSVVGGLVSGADVLAPGLAIVVPAANLGLNATDDLNALKCMQEPAETDKAVSDIVFDDGSLYPYDGPELPLHPLKGLPFLEVSADEPVVISVTSVEQNLGSVQPADALVGFYADIPPGCEGKWWDGSMPPPAFPNDVYTVGGDPFAPPFSSEQLGMVDPDPATKKPGDNDPDPQPSTFEVDLHFQTADYPGQYEEPPGSTLMITRFFDLDCPTPGQYHFWFCNKVEPKDLIDPNLQNNVWCEQMVVESLETTPTPTPTNTPANTPTSTPTPTSTVEPSLPENPSFSIERPGPSARPLGPWDAADILVYGPVPAVPCLALGLGACNGGDDIDALSIWGDFDQPPPAGPDGLHLHWLAFSVANGSVGAAGTAVNREHMCIGSTGSEPEADEFWSKGFGDNQQVFDGNGAACDGNAGVTMNLAEPAGDDIDALDDDTPATAAPPAYFSLDPASPSLGMMMGTPADIFVSFGAGAMGLYAPFAALGLTPADDVDALCIVDGGNPSLFDNGDVIYFSLAAGSPTLGAMGFSAADVLMIPVGAPVPLMYMPAARLGLNPALDDLDALKCYIPPVWTDADMDGLIDQWEAQQSCGPLGAPPFDFDGDTLTDAQEFSMGTDPCVRDTDKDGCADSEEPAGAPKPNPGNTGPYNPLLYWDFYDVPVPALKIGPAGLRDGAVTMSDVLAVLAYVGDTPAKPAYNTDLNGNTVKDGLEYDRSPSTAPNPPWDASLPDAAVTMSDVLAVLAQVGLSCAGPP